MNVERLIHLTDREARDLFRELKKLGFETLPMLQKYPQLGILYRMLGGFSGS